MPNTDDPILDDPSPVHRPGLSWAWRACVYACAAIAIALLAVITLAGSTLSPPPQPSDITCRQVFHHGWPWVFGQRYVEVLKPGVSDTRFYFWHNLKEAIPGALAGDLAVLVLGSLGIGCLACRIARVRRFTISLRTVAVVLTAVCIACGYVAMHLHEKQREDALYRQMRRSECQIWREYCGPVWLLRLAGANSRWLGTIFDHYCVVEVYLDVDPAELDRTATKLAEFTRLRTMILGGFATTSVEDRLLRFFAASKRWPVERLNIFAPKIGDDVLADLHQRFRLRKLSIKSADITDRGMIHLAKCQTLEEVGLEGCSISDEGVKLIAQCPRLVSVGLQNTAIGDLGIAELARCKLLERLSAAGTKVTVASVETFRQMPRLQELYLRECPGIRPEDHAAFHDLGIEYLWLDK